MEKIKTKIYKTLLNIRIIENKIADEYSYQKMRCPVHLSIGQEAVAAPLEWLFDKKDIIVSGHRAHSHYIGKGGNVRKFINELYGNKEGFSRGKAGSMHLYDKKVGFYGSSPIVGNIIPLGVGIALSNKLKKNNKIVIIFFGDGATEEGVFYESLNFASIHKLNIIFVCENNLYSVYSDLSYRQSKKRSLCKVAKSLGVSSFQSDGNDVNLTTKAFIRAKNFLKTKNKPIFLEFKTYRYLEHCGPYNDDHLQYRKKHEINKWIKKDPIKKLFSSVSKTEKFKLIKYIQKFNKRINKIFSEAKKIKYPKQSVAYEKLYK